MEQNKKYVWYAGYGSNLSKQRFECYIKDNGETPRYGVKPCKGCSDKTLPSENQGYMLPYRLYFALPNNHKETKNWGPGGVAFIYPIKEKNENHWTKGRIWKITRDQFYEIWAQEGETWYDKKITLGDRSGIPIITITNHNELTNILLPSERYLKTIIEGLRETFDMDNDSISSYLIEKEGIKNNRTKEQIMTIVQSV